MTQTRHVHETRRPLIRGVAHWSCPAVVALLVAACSMAGSSGSGTSTRRPPPRRRRRPHPLPSSRRSTWGATAGRWRPRGTICGSRWTLRWTPSSGSTSTPGRPPQWSRVATEPKPGPAVPGCRPATGSSRSTRARGSSHSGLPTEAPSRSTPGMGGSTRRAGTCTRWTWARARRRRWPRSTRRCAAPPRTSPWRSVSSGWPARRGWWSGCPSTAGRRRSSRRPWGRTPSP